MVHKKILEIIRMSEKHWVGDGFHVSSMISPRHHLSPYLSPFLLMDYAAPYKFSKSSRKRGVGEHPHRGFETVTLAYKGEVEHRDSTGGGGIISEGDVQWMTAGSGLVHEEFHSEKFTREGGLFEMVQLWVNLPKKYKMVEPRYQGIENSRYKRRKLNDLVEIKVVAGHYEEMEGPFKTYSPVNLFDLNIESGGEVEIKIEEGFNSLILVRKGSVNSFSETIKSGELAVFQREGETLSLSASEDSEVLVLSGEPIDEPIFNYGPFVMNAREEIVEAIEDYNSGKLGRIVVRK